MKNPLLTVLSVVNLLGLVLLIFLFLRQDKIVYVDSQKLLNGYKGMEKARKEYEVKVSVWKAQLDTLHHEVESKVKEYDSKGSKLSSKERALMEQVIQAKQDQFMNYQKAVDEKIKQEDQHLTTSVLSKMDDYIKKYGQDKGYKIILAATQYGNIIYAEQATNITDDILKGLNEEFSK